MEISGAQAALAAILAYRAGRYIQLGLTMAALMNDKTPWRRTLNRITGRGNNTPEEEPPSGGGMLLNGTTAINFEKSDTPFGDSDATSLRSDSDAKEGYL